MQVNKLIKQLKVHSAMNVEIVAVDGYTGLSITDGDNNEIDFIKVNE